MEPLPSMNEALRTGSSTTDTRHSDSACDPSNLEAEGGLGVQVNFQSHLEFKANLGYMTPCLKE